MILQSEAPECGIACVAMIASFHGFRTDLSAMRLRLAPSMKGVTLKHISAIADTMKLAARGVKVPLEGLAQLKLPAILHWDMNHFVVLTRVAGNAITVNDPARGRRVLRLAEVSDHYTGVAMEMTPATGFAERDEREKISAWQLVKTATGLRSAMCRCCSRWCSRSWRSLRRFFCRSSSTASSSAATAICWRCSVSALRCSQ
jgi:ATP-binding cassette subfamily B protein RaxB